MAATGVKSEKKSAARAPAKKSPATASTKAGGALPAKAISEGNAKTSSRGRVSSQQTFAKAEVPAKIKAAVAKTPVHTAATNAKEPQSRSSLSNNKTDDKIADKIHRFAVLKVTEVATKSSKTAASQAADMLLSEAQLLKMNDKDYMNEAQLAFFKTRLQQLEKDLLKNAGETTEHLRETVLVPDPADRATIEEEHALELRTRDRERKLLKKVQQSIASIDSGDYGWCEETGEPIGIPRLLARPTATLSLEAQQRRELKQKLYGD